MICFHENYPDDIENHVHLHTSCWLAYMRLQFICLGRTGVLEVCFLYAASVSKVVLSTWQGAFRSGGTSFMEVSVFHQGFYVFLTPFTFRPFVHKHFLLCLFMFLSVVSELTPPKLELIIEFDWWPDLYKPPSPKCVEERSQNHYTWPIALTVKSSLDSKQTKVWPTKVLFL